MPVPQFRFRVFLAAPVFVALLLSGCGGSDNSDDNNDITFSNLWKSDFSSCGTNCHRADASDGTDNGPNMSTQSVFYSNLINKNVSNDYTSWIRGGDCDDTPFITPSNAAKSTLMASLVESYSDELGGAENCTTSYNIHDTNNVSLTNPANVIDWINRGALNN